MDDRQIYRFIWQKTEHRKARLLRAYGTAGQVTLPETIGGMPLEEIGAYCFSPSGHLPNAEDRVEETQETDGIRWKVLEGGTYRKKNGIGQCGTMQPLRELCGDYISSVILPDTVRKIGNCAFYNCRFIKEIEVGTSAAEIGSDVFMNCKHFTKLSVRSGSAKATGIRKMLSQISSDMEVYLKKDGRIEALILFPEYSESYDEIAPAHLFGRNITGEGFRARQCFKEGVFDFAAYDAIFEKARAEETERTLLKMAGARLRYPAGLSEPAKEAYREYVKTHAAGLGSIWVMEQNLDMMHFLCREGLFPSVYLDEAVGIAVRMKWTEGAASLMRWKREYLEHGKEDRYGFDDF